MKLRTPEAACQGGAADGVSEIISLWQPRSARPLADSDACQIVANITGFFDVLLEWQSQEREATAVGKIEV